jgi:2-polyprenyl-3-methyl-5-hydroxy-6-metoxy-1,4-benzoquinol methylase
MAGGAPTEFTQLAGDTHRGPEASLPRVDGACWICDGPGAPVATLGVLGFRRCARCGFVFRPELDEAATRSVYEGGAYENRDFAAAYAITSSLDERRANARHRLAWLQGHVNVGRLLDVGAAGGAFVLEAARSGFDAFGVEPAPAFAAHAREALGVDVRDGRVEDLALPAGSVDVATMWHVLEHIPEPLSTLDVLRAALRPGGLLVVEVPNLDSVAARRDGVAWTHLDPEVHVSQFTPRTLSALLERAGFTVGFLSTVSHGTYLSRRERWTARHLAHRVRLARDGVIGLQDPTRHEFVRAVAQG